MEYPHVADNTCDGGTVLESFCLCNTTLEETATFTLLPSRTDILNTLNVGAFDPAMFTNGEYTLLNDSTADVKAYKYTGMDDYSTNTIFRVAKDEYSGDFLYLKNIHSVVRVCEGTFSFRNSPTFYDVVDPELISAYHETDAYLDHVHGHASAPPFVCKSLLKHFGYNNASPQQVLTCSNAFKSGVFTFTNPDNGADSLSYGEAGQRGNLAAVAASIILSSDALTPTADLDPTGGGVKSPLLKLTQAMRSFHFKRTLHHRRTNGFFNAGVFGENPYDTPDQFSFYSPHFLPAGAHRESHVSTDHVSSFVVNVNFGLRIFQSDLSFYRLLQLMAPEAELLTMGYVIESQNALYNLFRMGLSNCNGGSGPRWDRGTYRTCGNQDGLLTVSVTTSFL